MKKISLTLLFASGIAFGNNELKLKTAEDFVKFSSDVNSGTTFEGTTVLLESDIELSASANAIGDFEHYFLGTFDGQGSTISNLSLSLTSAKYAGLFGYTRGATVRNLVVDRSCSAISHFDAENDAYVGGIFGYCTAYYGQCTAENIVNMGSVTFAGNVYNYTLTLGGIAGYVYSYSHSISITNCANYGSVASTGAVGGAAFVGGVAGYFEGYSLSSKNTVANSANFGHVSYPDGASEDGLFVGGFAGRAIYATVENCVSLGKVDSDGSATGAILGYGNFTEVKHSFWTAEVGAARAYGVEPSAGSSLTNSSLAAVDAELVSNLNKHAHPKTETWGKWLLNAKNAVFTARINSQRGVSVSSGGLVLLTEPRNSGNLTFGGWFADGILSEPFKAAEIAADTTVYGVYGVLGKAKFDAGKGSVSTKSKMVALGKPYGELPVAEVAGNKFIWWYATVGAANVSVANTTLVAVQGDHVLHAGWEMNNVTFVMGDGTTQVVTVKYDQQIVYPQVNKRKGYKFTGWDKTVNMTMGVDITISALWEKKTTMSSTAIALCVVVPTIFILVVVVVIVIAVVLTKRRKNKYKYVSINENMYKALTEASSSYSEY